MTRIVLVIVALAGCGIAAAANPLSVTVDGSRIVLQGAGDISDVKYFALRSPPRLVIDLYGTRLGRPLRSTALTDGFSRLRVGTDADKTRVVLDAARERLPRYTVARDAGRVVVDWDAVGGTGDGLARPSPAVAPRLATSEPPAPAVPAAPRPAVTAAATAMSAPVSTPAATARVTSRSPTAATPTPSAATAATTPASAPTVPLLESTVAAASSPVGIALPAVTTAPLPLAASTPVATPAPTSPTPTPTPATASPSTTAPTTTPPAVATEPTATPLATPTAPSPRPALARARLPDASPPPADRVAAAATSPTTATGPDVAQTATPAAGQGAAPTVARATLIADDVAIGEVLARIAEVAGRRIVADPPVEGRLTLRLVDVPWDEALDMVAKIAGVRVVDQGDVIRVIGRPRSGARRATPAQRPGDGAFELPR